VFFGWLSYKIQQADIKMQEALKRGMEAILHIKRLRRSFYRAYGSSATPPR